METKKAAFLDRDGVINKEKEYLHKWEDFEYYPNSVEALKLLSDDPEVLTIITTGQSGIGRGKYDESDYQRLMDQMRTDLQRRQIEIDGIFFCPHLPELEKDQALPPYNENCECRKPKIGMIKQAQGFFRQRGVEIDLSNSCVIGDKTAEVKMAENAGCKGILVQTGYAGKEEKDRYPTSPDYIARDLLDGIKWWLNE